MKKVLLFIISISLFVGCGISEEPQFDPDQPSSLSSPNNKNSSKTFEDRIEITFDCDDENAQFYEIYRKISFYNGTEGSEFVKIGETRTKSYTDRNIEIGRKYWYNVKSGWRSSKYPELVTLSYMNGGGSYDTAGHTLMPDVKNFKASNDQDGKIVLSWDKLLDTYFEKYEIIHVKSGTEKIVIAEVENEDTTSFEDTSVEGDERKQYQIRSVSKYSVQSEYSPVAEGRVPYTDPSNLRMNYFTKILIEWDPASGTREYKIYKNEIEYATTASHSYEDLSGQETDKYKVQAISKNDTLSNFTNEITANYRTIPVAVTISWNANNEKDINQAGGGYKIHYSTTQGFSLGEGGVTVVDVPYVSGAKAPTSKEIYFSSGGAKYFKIVAYSASKTSLDAQEISVTVE